jgi:nucleotide-binding universal stress UspA family protein
MNKVNKILVPTDLSILSQVGVRHALELAQSQGAEVILYHVIAIADDWLARHDEFSPVAGLVEEQERLLDKFTKQKFADFADKVKIRQIVELGVPHKRIVEKAEEEGADLIVMSTHGRTGFDHMLIGSVTEKVVARASCPVLSIRPSADEKAAARAA